MERWNFICACLHGDFIYALASVGRVSEETPAGVFRCCVNTWQWEVVQCTGAVPSHRIHPAAAVIGGSWVVHGGRRVGKFNVQNTAHVLDLSTHRWRFLVARGPAPIAREWHAAAGVGNMMVVAGGRVDTSEVEPPNTPMNVDTMCPVVEVCRSVEAQSRPPASGAVGLLNRLREVHGSGALADVELVVEERVLRVHKLVLAAHSPVFERMLAATEMQEARAARVVIKDVSLDVMQVGGTRGGVGSEEGCGGMERGRREGFDE